MQLLPPLVTTAGVYHLPLSGRAAQQWAIALVVGKDGAADAALLADALAADPALTLWALCWRARQSAEPVRTIAALAQWLAEAAPRDWPGDNGLAQLPLVEGRLDVWGDLAANALRVARWAREWAARAGYAADAAFLDEAFLLGLVHAAPRWLASGVTQTTSPDYSAAIPNWLAADLCVLHGKPADHCRTPVDWVCRALQTCEAARVGQACFVPGGFTLDLAAEQAAWNAARQDWLRPAPAEILPRAIRKLDRLNQLEDRFEQTLAAEKLDSLKELAYGAGHEINNPLANISARAQTLLIDESAPDRRRMLTAIHTQAFRAHEMIADMMLFARPPQMARETLDLGSLLDKVLHELAEHAAGQNTRLVLQLPPAPLTVIADKTQVAVAVRAVLVNALEALVTGGTIEVMVEQAESETARVTVRDTGPGFGAEVARHLFDPFYSGREAGRGLGFGLSKCWRIVTLHGGTVTAESEPGRGATFTICLPMLPVR